MGVNLKELNNESSCLVDSTDDPKKCYGKSGVRIIIEPYVTGQKPYSGDLSHWTIKEFVRLACPGGRNCNFGGGSNSKVTTPMIKKMKPNLYTKFNDINIKRGPGTYGDNGQGKPWNVATEG